MRRSFLAVGVAIAVCLMAGVMACLGFRWWAESASGYKHFMRIALRESDGFHLALGTKAMLAASSGLGGQDAEVADVTFAAARLPSKPERCTVGVRCSLARALALRWPERSFAFFKEQLQDGDDERTAASLSGLATLIGPKTVRWFDSNTVERIVHSAKQVSDKNLQELLSPGDVASLLAGLLMQIVDTSKSAGEAPLHLTARALGECREVFSRAPAAQGGAQRAELFDKLLKQLSVAEENEGQEP